MVEYPRALEALSGWDRYDGYGSGFMEGSRVSEIVLGKWTRRSVVVWVLEKLSYEERSIRLSSSLNGSSRDDRGWLVRG